MGPLQFGFDGEFKFPLEEIEERVANACVVHAKLDDRDGKEDRCAETAWAVWVLGARGRRLAGDFLEVYRPPISIQHRFMHHL